MKHLLLKLDEFFSTLGKWGKVFMGAIVVAILGGALYVVFIVNDPRDKFEIAGFLIYMAVGFILGGLFTLLGMALDDDTTGYWAYHC